MIISTGGMSTFGSFDLRECSAVVFECIVLEYLNVLLEYFNYFDRNSIISFHTSEYYVAT